MGARDQLAYYSNYGSRIDLAAPGGARRYEIPAYDGGEGDILAGAWGSFGALEDKGLICTNPITSALFNSACFKLAGQGFGWLQGTSMSSPNAVGVAALTLSARQNLIGRPDALLARLQSTANQSPVNYMGPNDPANFAASLAGTPCTTGHCHIDQAHGRIDAGEDRCCSCGPAENQWHPHSAVINEITVCAFAVFAQPFPTAQYFGHELARVGRPTLLATVTLLGGL